MYRLSAPPRPARRPRSGPVPRLAEGAAYFEVSSASVVESEVDRNRGTHLDLLAVQHGGLVNPLADGSECGGHEERMSAHDAQVAHVAVDGDYGFDQDRALDAHRASHRRINR